ncbi:MAG: hypothetical protein ACT4O9_17240 [Blastocatellia bacterium]
MKLRVFVFSVILFVTALTIGAQNPPRQQTSNYPPADPMAQISMDLSAISRSVQTLSERMKSFVDKFEKVGGLTMTEKQQRFIMGLEILVRSEQRVATLQKYQIDLVEKQVQVKTRLTQIDMDMRQQSIDRSVVFEGSTRTPEIKEARLEKLNAERNAMQTLLRQVENNLSETTEGLREAQALVYRLRRTLIPQIEQEITGN